MKLTNSRRKFLSALGLTVAGTAAMGRPQDLVPGPFRQESIPEAPDDIKITDVKTYRLGRAIFVKVETNAGVSGWGESSPNSREVIESFIHNLLKKKVIGQSPFDVEPLWDKMYWNEHDLGPAGALPYSMAGIDLALWDIKGKVLGLPVHRLLGGQYRTEMLAYGGFPLRGGNVPVNEAVERALKLVDLGFKVIKLRMQIREYNLDPVPDPTLKYYEAVRKTLPDEIELFVDPNEGYTAGRAIQIGKALQEMGMKYFESPCPLGAHRDTRQVAEALDIPLLAGEKCYTRWQFRDLILEGNPDMIQPDVIKAGGITEVKKIAALGQSFFKAIVPHNTKPTLGTAACLHLMASISNAGPFIEYVELDTYQDVVSVFENQIDFRDGKMQVPDGPGLGLVMNEEKLERMAE